MYRYAVVIALLVWLATGCAGSKPGGTRNLVFDDNEALTGQKASGREALITFHDALKAKAKGEFDRAKKALLKMDMQIPMIKRLFDMQSRLLRDGNKSAVAMPREEN